MQSIIIEKPMLDFEFHDQRKYSDNIKSILQEINLEDFWAYFFQPCSKDLTIRLLIEFFTNYMKSQGNGLEEDFENNDNRDAFFIRKDLNNGEVSSAIKFLGKYLDYYSKIFMQNQKTEYCIICRVLDNIILSL